MRIGIYALIGAFAMPVSAAAQSADPLPSWSVTPPTGGPSLPSRYVPPPQGAWPGIGLSLPAIGLPLPPIGLRPPEQKHEGRRHPRPRHAPWPVMYVMVPQFATYVEQPIAAPAPAPVEQSTAKGSLVLHVTPPATQVFVDGYYAGTAEDFGGERGGTFLESAAHRIDLLAPGYEPVTFDVKIAANQSIAYRHAMKPIPVAEPVSALPKPATTFYLIPGCYMGNVPPKDAELPSTCDIARAQTFRN